jgi:long-chain acyl-CoA synthetase
MTETTALIRLNHPFHVAKGSIGKPLPGREVKLGADGEVLVRGPMISSATWSGGALRQRADEWLATGDLAEAQATGELRFMGRKSETIVTAAGLNVHPEDLEAALDEQPEVAACAVVAMETAAGPEPCAVLAVRGGTEAEAARAVSGANARLADFQQMRRWAVWPVPDLPRTSTGKVRRSVVAAWLEQKQAAPGAVVTAAPNAGGDWLVTLIGQIAGETPTCSGDETRLAEDFHLDSLGMVQLTAALEDRLRAPIAEGAVEKARTLGDLRRLITMEAPRPRVERDGSAPVTEAAAPLKSVAKENADGQSRDAVAEDAGPSAPENSAEVVTEKVIYAHWPWMWPVTWLRTAFLELIAQPLVWLLANPSVVVPQGLEGREPMLIICNHVTAYDGPLVQYSLPGSVRRRVAAAMSGEMLEDFRHFRNPERRPGKRQWMLTGPVAYGLLTALYNVFPLPRRLDFQRSFAHAGDALDRGYNVLVFPEGTRSAEGALARFRPGIGLLTKLSQTAVLPVAILGLGELKAGKRRWFRSGTLQVRVGEPIRFGPDESESTITAILHAAVERLLKGNAQPM